MKKRSFLHFGAASLGAALLPACSSTEMRRIITEDNTKVQFTGPFPYTDADRAGSEAAKRIFYSPRYFGSGVALEPSQRAGEALVEASDFFRRERIKNIPVELAGPLALATADAMRELVRLDEMKDERLPRTTRRNAGTAVTVPARSVVEFTQRGYCLDSTAAAPGKGEKFVLRHISSLIVPELLPLYYSLQDYAQREPRARRAMQFLTWALRDAGTRSEFSNAISPVHLRLMADAMPGGDQVFLRYHREKLNNNTNALGDFLRNVTTVRDRDGRKHNISDLYNQPDAGEALADKTMSNLQKRTVKGPIPKDDSDFSMLAPGVAANAVGSAELTPKITIANDTDTPFVFDSKEYFAESQRDAQRVALGAPKEVTEGGSGLSKTEAMRKLKWDAVMALRDYIIDHSWQLSKDLLPRGAMSRAVAPVLNAAPVVGSLLQLSNLIRGRDWLTDEKLGCAQQVLAAISTVPGAGMFVQVAGAGRMGAINALARSAVTERVITSVQRTWFARELANWLASDSVSGSNGMLPRNDVGDAIGRALSGGCERSWGA